MTHRRPFDPLASRIRVTDSAAAFSLIELLVVISITAILLAIAVPTVRKLMQSSRVEAGVNTVNVAVTAGRAYAGRDYTLMSTPFQDIDHLTPGFQPGTYSGTALLFTPANEIRIVENVPYAPDNNTPANFLELSIPSRSGYDDIPERDHIKIPGGVGIYGIVRTNSPATALRLLAPPFAIHFEANGSLTSGHEDPAEDDKVIYYDGNGDKKWQVSGTGYARSSPFGGGSYDPNAWTTATTLPFERIEAVIGVLIFSKPAYEEATYLNLGEQVSYPALASKYDIADATGPTANSTEEWLMTNGKVLMFSRSTGAIVKDN